MNTDEESDDFIVTPWEVEGEIDYSKLIKKFGTTPITPEMVSRIKKLTNGDLHYMIRRGLVISHRDLDWILNKYESGEKFALYTGRGPSENTHIGHLIPWQFTKWLQDKFDADLYFQLTDDEKFLLKLENSYQETTRLAYENATDVLALGFNPEKTHFIIDSEAGVKFRKIATEISKKITFSTIKGIFGFTESTNIGMIYHPAIQAAPCFYPSVLKGRNVPILIPAGIDQDPYWRATRDVAKRLGYYKPAAIHLQFTPGLEEGGKMSASKPESTIFTTDSSKLAEKKVKRAFTGGRDTIEEQKRLGGQPEKCNVFAWYRSSFESDDSLLDKRWNDCKSGTLMCGPCKQELADRVVIFLETHQAKRQELKEKVAELVIRE